MKKKLFALGLMAVMLIGAAGCSKNVSGGECLPENVPVRQTLERAGYTVSWDNATRTITAKNSEGVTISINTVTKMCDVKGRRSFQYEIPLWMAGGSAFMAGGVLDDINRQLNEDKSLAFRLNAQMDKNTNYVFSPFSLKMAMAMAANGAEGRTKDEVVSALGCGSLDELNKSMKTLSTSYNGEGDAVVNAANSLWINKDYSETEKVFNTSMSDNYKAEVTRVTIPELKPALNKWIKEKSKGLQDNLNIPIDDRFAMAIVNTTYFKAKWQSEFISEATYKQPFHCADGSEKETEFMHDTRHMEMYKDKDISMVKLDYRDNNRNLSFYAAMTDNADPEEYITKMESKKVALSLPKFKGDTTIKMNDMVKALGAVTMFSENGADFSNIFTDKNERVFVSDILQNTVIDVDEEGTEAASTTVMMACGATAVTEPEEIVEMKFDKPFTYFVRDNDTGEILFMGRYAQAE